MFSLATKNINFKQKRFTQTARDQKNIKIQVP